MKQAFKAFLIIVGSMLLIMGYYYFNPPQHSVKSDFKATFMSAEARRLLKAKDYHGAIAIYDKLVLRTPFYGHYYYNRGRVYEELGLDESALLDYNKAISLNGRFLHEFFLARGNLKFDQGRFGDAIADYSEAITEHNRYAEAYFNRGLSNSRLGRYERALRDYKHAFLRRSEAYEQLGEFGKAKEDCSKAMTLSTSILTCHR